MNDLGVGAIMDFPPHGADLEAKIHVFIIGGLISEIEASDRHEQLSGQQQRCRRNIVDVLRNEELRVFRAMPATETHRKSPFIDCRTSLLDSVVREKKAGTDRARCWRMLKIVNKSAQPTLLDERIIV